MRTLYAFIPIFRRPPLPLSFLLTIHPTAYLSVEVGGSLLILAELI